MRVITKCVIIENERFALIHGIQDNREFYGTIPHIHIDSNGRLKKLLNGLEMEVSFNSPKDAIKNRRCAIVLDRIIKHLMDNGADLNAALMSAFTSDEYQAIKNA